jgi:hypothetical protein
VKSGSYDSNVEEEECETNCRPVGLGGGEEDSLLESLLKKVELSESCECAGG